MATKFDSNLWGNDAFEIKRDAEFFRRSEEIGFGIMKMKGIAPDSDYISLTARGPEYRARYAAYLKMMSGSNPMAVKAEAFLAIEGS